MSAPPSMEVWIGDLTRSTMGMSAEVFGAYLRLLFYQWEHGKIPSRVDERQLVCGVIAERWDAVWARMSDRFVVLGEDGDLGHPRIAKDRPQAIERWQENKRIAEMRRELGRKGGKTRAKNQSSGGPSASKSSSNCLSKSSSKIQANLEGGRGKGEDGSRKVENGRRKTEEEIQRASEIDSVIAHYQTYHSRARPGRKERRLISERLRDGYSVADLLVAIDGCHVSPFHCGENDAGKKYQSLELIVRDSKHVTAFLEAWEQRNDFVLTQKERRGVRAAQQYLQRRQGDGEL